MHFLKSKSNLIKTIQLLHIDLQNHLVIANVLKLELKRIELSSLLTRIIYKNM